MKKPILSCITIYWNKHVMWKSSKAVRVWWRLTVTKYWNKHVMWKISKTVRVWQRLTATLTREMAVYEEKRRPKHGEWDSNGPFCLYHRNCSQWHHIILRHCDTESLSCSLSPVTHIHCHTESLVMLICYSHTLSHRITFTLTLIHLFVFVYAIQTWNITYSHNVMLTLACYTILHTVTQNHCHADSCPLYSITWTVMQTVLTENLEPLLWPWPWTQQINPFTRYFGVWWFIIKTKSGLKKSKNHSFRRCIGNSHILIK